jgi:hypothetical protein
MVGLVSRGEWAGWLLDGVIDVAGLEMAWAEVTYAGSAGAAGSSGDCRSKEEMLVMLLPATDSVSEDAYELCLTLEAVDETEPCLGW